MASTKHQTEIDLEQLTGVRRTTSFDISNACARGVMTGGFNIQGSSVLHDVTTPVGVTTLTTSSAGYFAAPSIGNLLILCGGRCRYPPSRCV